MENKGQKQKDIYSITEWLTMKTTEKNSLVQVIQLSWEKNLISWGNSYQTLSKVVECCQMLLNVAQYVVECWETP